MSARVNPSAGSPHAAAYRAMARDAGWVTRTVNYPIAARVCVVAHRIRARPTALTLTNLLLGSTGSASVVLAASRIATDQRWAVGVAVVAWLMWQTAYCADCADGQLARVTGTSSAAGGRLDVLCDVAVQIALVAAVAVVAGTSSPGAGHGIVAVFAAAWMINMVTSVMAKDGDNMSLLTSRSRLVELVKMARDYPVMVTVIAVTIAVRPTAMVWIMMLFTVVNLGFLATSIVLAARMSGHSKPDAARRPAGRRTKLPPDPPRPA